MSYVVTVRGAVPPDLALRLRAEADAKAILITTEPWGKPNSRFDSVAREAFLLNRPMFYLESVGIDALKRQLVARVRVAGTYVRLFVLLPRGIGERRMGKQKQIIHHHCNLAVKDWLKLCVLGGAPWEG